MNTSQYPHVHTVGAHLILLVMAVLAHDNALSVGAIRMHHMIMKRQTAHSPSMEKSHPEEQGSLDIHNHSSSDSNHDYEHLRTMGPSSITTSEISQTSENATISSPGNISLTSKHESEVTPVASTSLVQSSEGVHSGVDRIHHSPSIKSTVADPQEPRHHHHHHHHHHNHSHHHHHDHNHMERAHHHHHEHEEEKTHGHDSHHHHHSHSNPQNLHGHSDHHREETNYHGFTVPGSIGTIKRFTQAFKASSQIMKPSVSTPGSKTMTKMLSIPPKTLSTFAMVKSTTGELYPNFNGTSAATQKITKILRHLVITRPGMNVTFPLTKNETQWKNSSAPIVSTLTPVGKVAASTTLKSIDNVVTSAFSRPTNKVVSSANPKLTDRVISTTQKPTYKIVTPANVKQTDKVLTLATSKLTDKVLPEVLTSTTSEPTKKVNISSTSKPEEVVASPTLQVSDKINISSARRPADRGGAVLTSTDRIDATPASMPVGSVDAPSTINSTDKADRSTLKPTGKVYISSTTKLISTVETLSTVKSTIKADPRSVLKPVVNCSNSSTSKPIEKTNISSVWKPANRTDTVPTPKPTKLDSSPTTKQINKVDLVSTLKLTDKTVTSSIMKWTNRTIAPMTSTTTGLSTTQESKMTTTVETKEGEMNATAKSSDAQISNPTLKYNATDSTAFKRATLTTLSPNISGTDSISPPTDQYKMENTLNSSAVVKSKATTVKYVQVTPVDKTNKTSTSYSGSRAEKSVPENRTSVPTDRQNFTAWTLPPQTQDSVSDQSVSTTLGSSSPSLLNTSLGSSIAESDTPSSSLHQESVPLTEIIPTKPVMTEDENKFAVLASDGTNLTNSTTFFSDSDSLSTELSENMTVYASDTEHAIVQNSLVDQASLIDTWPLNGTDILLSQTNDTSVTEPSSATSKRKRRTRSRKTPISITSSTTSIDSWQSNTTTMTTTTPPSPPPPPPPPPPPRQGGSNNVGGGGMGSYFTTSQKYDDDTTTSSFSDYDSYSTQSSSSDGNMDAFNDYDITTSSDGNYDDDDDDDDDDGGTLSTSAYANGNEDIFNGYTKTQSASDYDDITTYRRSLTNDDGAFGRDRQSPFSSDPPEYDEKYDQSTRTTFETATSDYDEGYESSSPSTYRADNVDYPGDDFDFGTQSTSYNPNDGYDLSTRSTDGYDDDFKPKNPFDGDDDGDDDDDDDDDNDDYDYGTTDSSTSMSYTPIETNSWPSNFPYTFSSKVYSSMDVPKQTTQSLPLVTTSWPDDFDDISPSTETVPQQTAESLGTVQVGTKSPYLNFTRKRWRKRWQGYTNAITTTTAYTGPSTRRRETILHETATRFMPGGIKYRYTTVRQNESDYIVFNPWSRPPGVSTIFDYYKFRKVYYSKSRTFWEDVKHYFVKFVRIFRKDFRKGKRDG